ESLFFFITLTQNHEKSLLQNPAPKCGPKKTQTKPKQVAFVVQNEREKALKGCLDNLTPLLDSGKISTKQVMNPDFEKLMVSKGDKISIFKTQGTMMEDSMRKRMGAEIDTTLEINYTLIKFLKRNKGLWPWRLGGWETHFVQKFPPKKKWSSYIVLIGKQSQQMCLMQQYY
uniref:Uncharacterized protein n=1 Tax=Sus scrofa TaxID=9823 RepID=A0A8D1SMV0_PIG